MTDAVSILDGQEGGFWDVVFADGLAEAAGVETDMRTILVHIEDDGALSLSAGWEPRSPEGRDERALMRVHSAAISAALARDDRIQAMHPTFVRLQTEAEQIAAPTAA